MIFKKILRYLTLVIASVFLLSSHKIEAEHTSKLLDSKSIQKVVNQGTLNVGVKQDVPNFGYYSAKTNSYEGMEVDLAKKIADELKVKVNYIPVTTQTREPLKFNYVQLGSFPELAVSLYSHRVNAFSVDKSILSGYESKKTKTLNEGFKTQEYGIASSKSNQELIDYTNDLIAKWQKDGSLQKLYDKYHLKPAKAEDK